MFFVVVFFLIRQTGLESQYTIQHKLYKPSSNYVNQKVLLLVVRVCISCEIALR